MAKIIISVPDGECCEGCVLLAYGGSKRIWFCQKFNKYPKRLDGAHVGEIKKCLACKQAIEEAKHGEGK